MKLTSVFSFPTDPHVIAARISSIGPVAPIDAHVPGRTAQTLGADFSGFTGSPQVPMGFMSALHRLGVPDFMHKQTARFHF